MGLPTNPAKGLCKAVLLTLEKPCLAHPSLSERYTQVWYNLARIRKNQGLTIPGFDFPQPNFEGEQHGTTMGDSPGNAN